MVKTVDFDTFRSINTLQHHGVCLQNELAMQTTLILVVMSHIKVLHNSRSLHSRRARAFLCKISDKMVITVDFDTFRSINTLQHHGVCLRNELGMQTTLILVVVSHIKGSTHFPEHT